MVPPTPACGSAQAPRGPIGAATRANRCNQRTDSGPGGACRISGNSAPRVGEAGSDGMASLSGRAPSRASGANGPANAYSPASSPPLSEKRARVIRSARHSGQRLGREARARSRNSNPHATQRGGSTCSRSGPRSRLRPSFSRAAATSFSEIESSRDRSFAVFGSDPSKASRNRCGCVAVPGAEAMPDANAIPVAAHRRTDHRPAPRSAC